MSEKCSDCGKKEALYYAGGQIDSYKYCLECWANNSDEPVTELLANQKSAIVKAVEGMKSVYPCKCCEAHYEDCSLLTSLDKYEVLQAIKGATK